MGCVVWVCSKRLWQNASSILMHKSTGNFVVAQASTLTPKCVCISGKPAFATQIPSTNRSLRFTGVGRLCGNQHQVHQVCVLVRYRKRVTPLTAKCLQLVLTDTSCPWNPIWFLVSHATFPPFPCTYQPDSSRARPAQSENIAIDNPIDSGRMDKDAVTIVRFAFSTQVISFR